MHRFSRLALATVLAVAPVAFAVPAQAASSPNVYYYNVLVADPYYSHSQSYVYPSVSAASTDESAITSYTVDWGDGNTVQATTPVELGNHYYPLPTAAEGKKIYNTTMRVCTENSLCTTVSYAHTVYSLYTTYQENNVAAVYSGTWKRTYNTKHLRSYAKVATAFDSKAYFIQRSGQTTVIGVKGPTAGKVEIYYDGVRKATLSLYSSTTKYRQVLWTSSYDWNNNQHKLQVRVVSSGKPVTIDAYRTYWAE